MQRDASQVGIGGALKQEGKDSKLHPVAYFSKKLQPYESNYSISELECLAIVETLDYWHHYLYGKKFTVITDHQALQWLSKMKKPRSRLFKWSLKLGQYDFIIQYKPGDQNVEEDALSRSPVLDDFSHNDHIRIVNLITKNELKREQQIEKSQGKNMPPEGPDGIAIRKKGLFHQKYVPQSLREQIIKQFHEKFGHIGTKKTIQMISKSYTWPKMTNDIKNFTDSCETCRLNKIKRCPKLGTLSILKP